MKTLAIISGTHIDNLDQIIFIENDIFFRVGEYLFDEAAFNEIVNKNAEESNKIQNEKKDNKVIYSYNTLFNLDLKSDRVCYFVMCANDNQDEDDGCIETYNYGTNRMSHHPKYRIVTYLDRFDESLTSGDVNKL